MLNKIQFVHKHIELSHLNQNEKYDIFVGKIFALFLTVNAFNICLKSMFPNSTFFDNYLTIILGVFFLVSFLSGYRYIRKAIYAILATESIFAGLLMFSVLVNISVASQIISRCVWMVVFCLPLFSLAFYVYDTRLVIEQTKTASLFVLALSAVCLFSTSNDVNYNMSVGYLLLYPCVFHYTKISHEKKNLFFFLVELLLIVLFCSRGPLLCVAIGILIDMYSDSKKVTKKQIINTFAIFVGLSIVLLFWNEILQLVNNYMTKYGITSRTLRLLINSKISFDSGRNEIHKMIIEKIFQKPFLGWGVAGEFNFMNSYPHHLFLEILLHFGIILGSIFCALIIYLLIKKYARDRFSDETTNIFFCSGFICLFISSTYLQAPVFWMLMGICISKNRRKSLRK